MEQDMNYRTRLGTDVFEAARSHCYKPGSWSSRILAEIVEFRRVRKLKERTSVKWAGDDEALWGQLMKVATIFEAIKLQGSPEDRLWMLKELKQKFSPGEVNDIVDEYYPDLRDQLGER